MEKYCRMFKDKGKVYLPVWCISLFLSVCVYGQLMTQQLVNAYDGLWEYTYHEAGKWEMSLGRWFWLYIDRLRFGLSNDPWTSCLTIICFTIGMCLLFDIFECTNIYETCLISMIFLSSSAVCISLSYRYMSPTFGLAFLLSIFAVWMVLRIKNVVIGVVGGALSVALMMGLYQAYLGCTCLLIVGVFLWYLSAEADMKIIGKQFLKCAFSIALGGILYILLLNLHLKIFHVTMSSYNGADSYSIFNTIRRLPDSIKGTYVTFYNYFFGEMFYTNMLQSYHIYWGIFSLLLLLFVIQAVRIWRKSRLRALCFLALLAVVPIACNAVMLVATEGGISLQMTGAFALCIPVLVCVVLKMIPGSGLWNLPKYGLLLLLLLVLWGNIYQTQIDQNAMYEGKIATTAMTAEIMNGLSKEECLNDDLRYCFIGLPAGNELFFVSEAYGKANRYAQFGMGWGDPGSVKKSWNGIWHYVYGVNLPIYSTEECQEFLTQADVENMPVFPQKGYVKRVDDVVFIKISE